MGTKSTFWGLAVKPKKLFKTEVEVPFRITKACLAPPSNKDSQVSSVYTKSTDTEELIIANLDLKHCSVMLDLFFNPGEKICFRVSGSATVHLSGNILVGETGDGGEVDEPNESRDEDAVESVKNRKRGNSILDNPQIKKVKLTIDSDSEGDSNSEGDSESMDDGDSNSDDDGDSDVGNIIEEKLNKADSKITKFSYKPVSNKTQKSNKVETVKAKSKKIEKAKNDKSNKETLPQHKPTKQKEKVEIVDIVVGTGAVCRRGNGVGVHYHGRLQTNSKVFDSCRSGKPFKFKLGWGQVIKGWDEGMLGMRVGGKRRLVVPPSLAYGCEGAAPDIPRNSTLIFDIDCKFVKVYGGNQEW